MRIIVAGDGEVGLHLAKFLTEENHNITVIDTHNDMLQDLGNHYDLMTITGDSTSLSILNEANVDKADLVISVLHDEKINILTSLLAKKLGAKSTIARVSSLDYLTQENKALFKGFGIDSLVCPEKFATDEIVRLLNNESAVESFDFSEGKLSLYMIKLEEESPLLNKTLSQVATENPNLKFRAVALHRDSQTIIPRGNDKFLYNDLAYVISKPEGVDDLFRLAGKSRYNIKKVMIIGGSRVGRMSAKRLQNKYNVKLLDINRDWCESLADEFDNVLIINGDGRNVELLEDEGIKNVDAFIATTDNSETNIFTCLLAKKYGVKKVIALVDDINYIDISHNIGIDSMINKKQIAASYIYRFTMTANVSSIKCLNGVDAEVLEFVVKANSVVTQKPIMDVKFPEGAIIGGIIRGDKGFIAIGSFQIQENDKVVVFSMPSEIKTIQNLFE